jgi:preprotein translocase subunit Sec63
MKPVTVVVLGALLATAAACRNESSEDRPEVPAFIMQQCTPVDPQCQLAEPPHLDERPEPGAQ